MKIRQGFVSNSSSSSFCVLGVLITDEQYDMADSIPYKDRILNTHCGINDGDDSKYLGFDPYKMDENETLSQFKDRIVAEAAKIGIEVKKNEIDWHTDGGYNG